MVHGTPARPEPRPFLREHISNVRRQALCRMEACQLEPCQTQQAEGEAQVRSEANQPRRPTPPS
jgi:hypothetical protein